MGRILSKIEAEKTKEPLEALIDDLTKIKKIMEDDSLSKEEREQQRDTILDKNLNEIKALIDQFQIKSIGEAWNFSKEKAMDIFTEDDVIYLRGYRETENEWIRQVQKENSNHPEIYNDDWAWKISSKWLKEDRAFVCSIFEKSQGNYIGYISLKNTERNLWEISIELLEKFCNKGYGTRAIKLFLPAISAVSGKTQFQALVETDNIPSQLLMEKCGAKLIDIYDYSYDGDEEAAALFEESHLEMITERMVTLAAQIQVEPRQLLSHVLDYRFFVEDGKILDKARR